MSTIEKLPNEVLEKILLFLPGCTIPTLTTVSSQFRDVISGSVKLMNNFEVQWQKNKKLDMRPLLESKRKYRRIHFLEVSGFKASLKKFITSHALTLTSVSFHDCFMTTSDLRNTLVQLAANLEEFNMCGVNIEADCDVEAIEMPKMREMEIMYGQYEGYTSVLPFFSGIKIRRLNYEDDFEMDREEMRKFAAFLTSLNALESLSLTRNVAQSLFASSDFTLSFKSPLKDLHLRVDSHEIRESAIAAVYANIRLFLASLPGLKDLTMARCGIDEEMLNFLLSLKLQKLGLFDNDFGVVNRINTVNQTIKRIFLSSLATVDNATESAVCDLLQCCENVKKLQLVHLKVTTEIALTMRYHMPNLEKLVMNKCDFAVFSFPTLKHLEVTKSKKEKVILLVRVNRQLETLKVSENVYHNHRFQQAVSNELSINSIDYD